MPTRHETVAHDDAQRILRVGEDVGAYLEPVADGALRG